MRPSNRHAHQKTKRASHLVLVNGDPYGRRNRPLFFVFNVSKKLNWLVYGGILCETLVRDNLEFGVAATVRYVRLRKGIYQYERRVPLDIVRDADAFANHFGSVKLFRRTLDTKSLGGVHRAAVVVQDDYDQRVRLARQLAPPLVGQALAERLAVKVTPDILDSIKESQLQLVLRPWIDAYVLAEQGGEYADEFERMRDHREMFAEQRKAALLTQGAMGTLGTEETPLAAADDVIELRRLDAPPGSTERSFVAIAVRQGRFAGEAAIDRLLAGEMPTGEHATTNSGAASRTGPTIRDAVDRYLADKGVRPKTARELRTTLALFERIVGNKRLPDLKRRDVSDFIEALASKVVGAKSPDGIARPTARDTVKKRVGSIRTVINHAIERGIYEGGNVASSFRMASWVKSQDRAIMPEKRPFQEGELNLIFQHPWFTGCASARQIHKPGSTRLSGSHYWVPIAALYTGCRASELGGLKLAEIVLAGELPHISIRDNEYRPTKGGYARLVPILDDLLALGFAAYVDALRKRGEDRLFPDWKPPRRASDFDKDDAAWSNASIIRAFNRTVIVQQLKGVLSVGARREVTFHSFRGAFKSMIGLHRFNVPDNNINEVIGHAKSAMNKRYVSTVPLEETYSSIHACGWPNLHIPRLPVLRAAA
jgi:integrase